MEGGKSKQERLTVFFSDIANSTWLYQQKGDVEAHRLIMNCLDQLRECVESHRGSLLRTVGDAVLASFPSADDAFNASISAQRSQISSPLDVRVGFHFGDVIPDAGDVYGNAVNIAARVASFANAREIYTSEDTVQYLSADLKRKAAFLDRIDFKGITDPLGVYRVHWNEAVDSPVGTDTRIVTAVSHSQRFHTDTVLDLLIGDLQVRLDSHNPKVSIGRTFDNDIIIDHDSTSRQHAVIEFERGRYTIKDVSTNGTYVVREGKEAVFVRRESLVLDQHGMIGAGWLPDSKDPDRITYRSVISKTT